MTTLQIQLVQTAREIVQASLKGKKRPVIMFSGGKDSVVMLYLIRQLFGLQCDVLLHREPWQTHKYAFAEKVIRDAGCTAYDYPPTQTALWMGKGIVAFTNFYQTCVMPDGRPGTLALPKNIIPPRKGEQFVCGRFDIIERPKGTFEYPWDVCFIGHKDSDEDQIAGKVPLHQDLVDNEQGPRLSFPLRYWKDEDVWDLIELLSLPYQKDRYAGRRELADKYANSDYFPVCIRCIDRREKGETVPCPRLENKPVPNVSKDVPYAAIELDYFG